MTLVVMMVIMIIEERDFEICGDSSFSSDLKHFNRKIFFLKIRIKCESKIVINVSALIPFENVEGLGNDSAELDILRLTGQHCVRGPDICPWIGTSEPGNREVMRSAKLTEKMKSDQ